MSRRCRYALALAAALGVVGTTGQAQTTFSSCNYWKPGHEMPVGAVVTIRRVVFPDTAVRHKGSTKTGKTRYFGYFRFSPTEKMKHPTSSDDFDTTPLAVFTTEDGRRGFLVSREGKATFTREDGGKEPAMSGRLEKLRVLIDRDIDPIQCVRVPKRNLLPVEKARAEGVEIHGEVSISDAITEDDDPLPGEDRGDLSDIFNGDGTVKASPDGASDLTDALGGLGARSEPGLSDIVPPRDSNLADLGKDDGPDPRASPTTPTEQRVCPLNDLDLVPAGTVFPDVPMVVAGRVATDQPVPGYIHNEVVREFFHADAAVRIPFKIGEVIAVHLPFGARTVVTTEETAIIPAQVPDARAVAGAVAAPEDDHKLRLVIVSDAAALAESGLDAMEARASRKLGNVFWLTEWHEILPDGRLTARGLFSSMSKAVERARETETQSVLNTAGQIETLAASIESLLRDAPQTIDQLYWITEGFQFPANTPQTLETMLANIAKTGNLRRESDGLVKPWLHIIAGQFNPEYSAGYLQGPMSTSRPPAGYLSIEEPRESGKRERILSNLALSVSRLERLVKERARDSDIDIAAPKDGGEPLLVNANNVFIDMGVIIDNAHLSVLLKDMPATRKVYRSLGRGDAADTILVREGSYDLGALLDPKTNADGSLRSAQLDANVVKRRLTLMGLAADSPFVASHLNDIEELLSDISVLNDASGCDKYYVSSEQFGANWVFTP